MFTASGAVLGEARNKEQYPIFSQRWQRPKSLGGFLLLFRKPGSEVDEEINSRHSGRGYVVLDYS